MSGAFYGSPCIYYERQSGRPTRKDTDDMLEVERRGRDTGAKFD